MSNRKTCLLKNQELMEAILKLKNELFKDFSENVLKECDSCNSGLTQEDARKMHLQLLQAYNILSNIKRMLEQKGNK